MHSRHMYLQRGSTILLSSIEATLHGPQLRTITNVDYLFSQYLQKQSTILAVEGKYHKPR